MMKCVAKKTVASRAGIRAAPRVARPAGGLSRRQQTVCKSSSANKNLPAIAAAVSTVFSASAAHAVEVNQVYGDLASDNRVGVLAFLIAPALGWVLFNSTQGLLGQYDRTKKEADRIEKKTNKFF
ncbi:photosystem II protein Y [Chloropicon roscoffensis]|uniref:Photosystem II protein Y n=1 Tax=Chloropicon roscoffensis TaxID=1461544 RepID=A0AAX4P2J1_9CHLO|mmetsp:Transcript_1759/g.5532  ORF Transcript_1759/g.5532 Transcript_1759/m.5532 type:complete len:125 (-) Transcript_1759:128-502(-)